VIFLITTRAELCVASFSDHRQRDFFLSFFVARKYLRIFSFRFEYSSFVVPFERDD
jgi:hypothetical protein